MKNKSIVPLILAAFLSIGIPGCTQTTTEKTTVVSDSDAPRSTETTSTTTTTETDSDACSGVLSCTVHAIGVVIALPFKAVGALIGAIF